MAAPEMQVLGPREAEPFGEKVYGVEGLRVIDMSFSLMILTASPLATTYAMGEKVGTCFLLFFHYRN